MKSQTSQIFKRVEKLSVDRRFVEASKELLQVDQASLTNEDYGLFCILKGEVMLHLGEYHQDLAEEAIEIYRFTHHTEYFSRAMYLKGRFQISIGNHFDARETLLEAYVGYLRCKNMAGASDALNRLSQTSFQVGEPYVAIRNIEKCIEIQTTLNDHGLVAVYKMNLAFLLFMVGQVNNSISKYKEIADVIVNQGDRNVCAYYNMSAIPYALKGDYKKAHRQLNKCQHLLDEYPREKAIWFENLGFISTAEGDYKTAEKALSDGLEISLEIAPKSALVSQIKRLFGDLYVATNKLTKAKKFALEGLKVAEGIGQKVEIAACYRVFAQVDELQGKKNSALKWYRQAIDIFDQIDSRYELAITRYLIANSGFLTEKESSTLLYLAKEYFETEDINHCLALVDKALAAIKRVMQIKPINPDDCPVFITNNDVVKKILKLAERVAVSDMNILLTGETGTGKDLLAKYIHHFSGRKGDFVSVNMAALPITMIESELFGYKKGAFTGAEADRSGLFEQADNGTFFLNEIGDASPELQAKLLEVIETRKIRRLGENKTRKVSFRLIAATNRDLVAPDNGNNFRIDLYHRLHEIPFHLPPLSARTEDIAPLVYYFLDKLGYSENDNGSAASLDRLISLLEIQSWSGNIRELYGKVRLLYSSCGSNADLMIKSLLSADKVSDSNELNKLLCHTGWNRSQVASLLGVSEGTVRKQIKKHGLSEN